MNHCKLTECQGKPRCAPCRARDLRVIGVSRDCGSPAILVAFDRELSDDELRDLHERLQALYRPKLRPACAWPFPGQVERAAPGEGGGLTDCDMDEDESR
jgi:hypothetical protein